MTLKALRPGIRQPQDHPERISLSGLEDASLAAIQFIACKENQRPVVHFGGLSHAKRRGKAISHAVGIILPGGDGIPRHRRYEVQHYLIDYCIRPRPCAVEGHIPGDGPPAVCLLGAGLIRVPGSAKVILLIQNHGPYKKRTAAQHLPAFGSPPLGLSFRRGRANGSIPHHLIADLKVPVGPGKGHIAAHRLAHGVRIPCARAKAAVRCAGRDIRRRQLRAFRHRQLLLVRPILPAAVYRLEGHGTQRHADFRLYLHRLSGHGEYEVIPLFRDRNILSISPRHHNGFQICTDKLRHLFQLHPYGFPFCSGGGCRCRCKG